MEPYDWLIAENEVVRCGTLTVGVVGCGDGREAAFEWTSGIKIWGWGEPGWVGTYAIVDNHVRDAQPVDWAPDPKGTHGHGIWCDEVLKPKGRPVIRGNQVNTFSRGVYLEKTDDHDVHDNFIHHCAQVRFTGGLEVQSNPLGYDVKADRPDDHLPRVVKGNRLFHNTVIGGWWALAVHCSSAGCSLSDTEVRDNICVGKGGRSASLYFHGGGANDGVHGSGNLYVRNCFGPEGGSWVWGQENHRTAEALEQAAEGAVRELVVGDPRFLNAGEADYRLRPDSPCIGAASNGENLGVRWSQDRVQSSERRLEQ